MQKVALVNDSTFLPRGVYKAPYSGPRGEWVFMAIKADHTLLTDAPVMCPYGCTIFNTYELLWKLLEAEDPLSTEELDAMARRQQMRAV